MLEWPDATLYQGIREVADGRPDSTALFFRGERTAYADLLARSDALAAGLADLGVGSGDRVAVWLGNRPEWVQTQLAASRLGAAVVAVNTRYRTHELAYMLDDSDCVALVTERAFLDNEYFGMLADVVPEVREADPDDFDPRDYALTEVVGLETDPEYPAVRGFEDVVARGRDAPDVAPAGDPERPAAVFYTSGTTGDPKGCLQSGRSLLNHSYNVGTHFDLADGDVALGVLPFPGVWGYNTFMSALAHGIPLVVQTHFDPGRALSLVEDHGVTYVSALATMLERMREHETFAPERVATLEKGAMGFLSMGYDEETFEELEDAFGVPWVQPYGLSEANSQVFVGDPADPRDRRKRVGGPPVHPGTEVRVADPETGETLGPGEEGELRLRGYNVMEAYHGKPEETAEAFDEDGWLRTGDLGTRDGDGYFYFRSRVDDALRVRGFLVTPREIETVVDDQPGVAASQVVGAPHPRHGEVPVAFVRRSDPDLDADALRDALAGEVADYKVPEDVEFVESFPRSEGPHGEKVQKSELRDRVADRYAE